MRLTHGYPVACFMAALLAFGPAFAAPQRVVSTFLCTDEYVFRLVPRDHIAALSFLAADTHPVVSTIKDKVGGIPLTHNSAEEVLQLKPDLVATYQGTEPGLKAHLIEAHVPFVEIPDANSLADIRNVTRTLGKALGASARADALIAEMDRKLSAAAINAPHPSVAVLIYEPNGYASSSAVTDEILRASGLKDMAATLEETRAGTIPVEEVVAAPPELLILNGGYQSAPSRGELILQHPALRNLARTTLVARADLTPLLCPGPWSVNVAPVLQQLAREARSRDPRVRNR